MINIYELEIFLAVVDRGSFTAAATALKLTQPAVSMHIRTLEHYYSTDLFHRAGQRIELTNAGHALADLARPLVRQAGQLDDEFSANVGIVRGRIVIGSSSAPAEYITPLLFQQFKTRFSEVQLAFHMRSEEQVVEGLLERELNFGIVGGRPRQRELEAHMLMSDELQLIAPLSHPFFARAGTDAATPCVSVMPDDLRKQPFVIREVGSSSRRIVESALRAIGLNFHDMNVVGELPSAEMVELAVEAGLGISFVSSVVSRRFAGRVGLLRVEGLHMAREVYMVRDTERNQSPAQQRFWQYITSAEASALLARLQGR